jgi:hypothetical protein
MASPYDRVLITSNSNEASGVSLRNVWVGGVAICGCWIRIGWTKMVSTNITKSSLLTPTTKLYVSWLSSSRILHSLLFRFVVIPESTGSRSQCTNAAKRVVLRALENRFVVWRSILLASLLIPQQNRGLGKGHRHNHTPARSTWKRHNTLSLRRYRWMGLGFYYCVSCISLHACYGRMYLT